RRVRNLNPAQKLRDCKEECLGGGVGGFVRTDKVWGLPARDAFAGATLHFGNDHPSAPVITRQRVRAKRGPMINSGGRSIAPSLSTNLSFRGYWVPVFAGTTTARRRPF